MFLGEYDVRIGDKNRIAIPARFRADFQPGLVLAQGMDDTPYLNIFTFAEWERFYQRISAVPIEKSRGREARRLFFASAFSTEIDRQGRFVLPPTLLQYAQFADDVIIVGAGDHMEIWNKDVWSQHRDKLGSLRAQLTETLE